MNDVGVGCGFPVRLRRVAQELRGNVPPLAGVGNHCHRLLIVPGDHSHLELMAGGLKFDPLSDPELEHLHVGAHLMNKPKPLNDAVVEIDQFGFAKIVDVDLHVVSQR